MYSAMKTAILCVAMTWSGIALAVPIMHVHDGGGNLGTVDVANGDVNLIGPMGVVMTDIAFNPAGDLFGISFSGLYSIDSTTAAATFIGNHGVSGGNALVFGTDGTLYSAGFASTSLFTIDPTTGSSTNLGSMGFASAGDLAFNNGNFFLASTANELVQIDLGNLSNTAAVGAFGVGGVFGLASGDNDVLYAVAGTTLYEVDTATGAVTNPISFASQGLSTAFGESFFTEAGAGDPPSVPEPGSLGLLGIGLLLGFARRKRAA